MNFLKISVLLAFPVYAVVRQGEIFYWVLVAGSLLSFATYWVYAVDKRRARAGEWRIPEAQLHLLELLGGWPGAFLAQRRLRHKCSKGKYLLVFWLIVIGYQFAAVDSLQDWRISRAGLKWITDFNHE